MVNKKRNGTLVAADAIAGFDYKVPKSDGSMCRASRLTYGRGRFRQTIFFYSANHNPRLVIGVHEEEPIEIAGANKREDDF